LLAAVEEKKLFEINTGQGRIEEGAGTPVHPLFMHP